MSFGYYFSALSPSSGTRALYDPDGNIVPTPGTGTQGINEGIALAIQKGYAFKCFPGGGYLQCTAPMLIPPCANADIDLGGSDFEFTGNGAFQMDSFNGGRFFHSGRMVYTGVALPSTAAFWIAPRTADPVYGQKIIQNADISFGNCIVANTPVGAIVELSVATGSIMNNKNLSWQMIDGWDGVACRANTCWMIQAADTENSTGGFNENFIRIGQCQGFTQYGMMLGLSPVNGNYIGDNQYEININSVGVVPGMLMSFSSYDHFFGGMTIFTGSCEFSLMFNAGARYNRWLLRQDTTQYGVAQGTGNSPI